MHSNDARQGASPTFCSEIGTILEPAPQPFVGSFARDHGVLSQGRLIDSAKSWLCHAGVDRTAELLPWHGLPEVEKISPVDASARYLKYIHDAWNHQFPESPMAEQPLPRLVSTARAAVRVWRACFTV